MINPARYLHRAALIGLGTACFLIMPSFASGAEHQNPSNYDFIEWQGWGGWDGVITGRVIDKNGNPIPHATVQVHSKNISVNADRNGYFTIRGLQQGGRYSLIITARGREVGVARLVPIPQFQSADIGDFSLDNQMFRTNFWVVSSNRFEESVWLYVSNFYTVEESVTTRYSYTEWRRLFSTNYLWGFTAIPTNPPAGLLQQPTADPAGEPAAPPQDEPLPDSGQPAGSPATRGS